MVALNEVLIGSGLLESISQVAVLAGFLLIVLMCVALGSYAYKQLRGGGVEWPEDKEDGDADQGVSKGGDDEWKYS